MSENRALKRYLKTLEHMKLQITGFNTATPISEIKAALALLLDGWREFQSLEKSLKGKFDDSNLDSVEKIENLHSELKRKLFNWEKAIDEQNSNQGNCTMDDLVLNQSQFLNEISHLTKRESEIRLPRVNIPIFAGKYSEFPSFRDLFEASIHHNSNISKVHKLQYLKGLLKGEAFSLINHLTVTDANYDEAWDKVKARYDKRRHVVHTLLKQFMEQPSLHQSCAKSIRHLADISDEVIRGLKVLGEQAEGRDPWLIYVLVNKLDNESKEAWAHETAEIDFPTLNQLFKFLNKRSDALESLNSMKMGKSNAIKRVNTFVSEVNKIMCPLCSEEHYLGRCADFLKMSVHERRQLIVDKKLCFNCLASTHQASICKSRFNCKLCRRRHHLSLHPETDSANSGEATPETSHSNLQSNTSAFNVILKQRSASVGHCQAILPTATVIIEDKFGTAHRCRALLDSGSQSSFVSERCVQRLQLQRQKANISISGITAGSLISSGKTMIPIKSIYSNQQIVLNALIINKLPSRIPAYNIANDKMHLFEHIELADPDFHKSAPIDILIGADKFFAILENEQKHFESTILQKTMFGWIVSGQSTSLQHTTSSTYATYSIQLNLDVDRILRQFWEMEEMPQPKLKLPEDEKCEENFVKTHKRQEDGRYQVQLPFKESTSVLGNSLNVATQRFISLERKLATDLKLQDQYIEQMREYLSMGHMVEISQPMTYSDKVFYLPHHAIVKESSETTKVRVVFDGSSKSTSGIALNDILMVGPTIQPTLWATLMRFRCNRIAITADIERMYRQVVVAPSDTNYQRILWRERPDQRLRHFKLTRVTFGLACSAYLAIRTLPNKHF